MKGKIKWRKFKRKARNFILNTISGIAVTLAMISGCALDLPSRIIPMTVLVASMAWLFLFAYANGMVNDYGEEEGKFYVDR